MDLQLGKINTFTNIIEEAGYSEIHKMIWLFMSVRCFETCYFSGNSQAVKPGRIACYPVMFVPIALARILFW